MKSFFVVMLMLSAAVAQITPSLPAPAQKQQRLRVDRTSTQQKAIYLRRLLTGSVAVRTIEVSDDDVAKANLEKARALVDEAQRDLFGARIEAADTKLNRALALVNSEARRLSHAAAAREHQRAAYDKRLHTVETFLKAYERVAGGTDSSPAIVTRKAELRDLVASARAIAAEGRLEKATSVLDRAYKLARGDIRELRAGKTLVRSLDFDTPEKEYRYEAGRNDSHLMLLKFALGEKNPPQVFRKRIDELRRRALRRRSAAMSRAEAGDYLAAIDEMSQSTNTLLMAIRMTGLYIPG